MNTNTENTKKWTENDKTWVAYNPKTKMFIRFVGNTDGEEFQTPDLLKAEMCNTREETRIYLKYDKKFKGFKPVKINVKTEYSLEPIEPIQPFEQQVNIPDKAELYGRASGEWFQGGRHNNLPYCVEVVTKKNMKEINYLYADGFRMPSDWSYIDLLSSVAREVWKLISKEKFIQECAAFYQKTIWDENKK